MNVVGTRVTIMDSRDPTKKGVRGEVVLETAKTLLLDSSGRRLRIEKEGAVFLVDGSKQVISGSEIVGRLEERLRSNKK